MPLLRRNTTLTDEDIHFLFRCENCGQIFNILDIGFVTDFVIICRHCRKERHWKH